MITRVLQRSSIASCMAILRRTAERGISTRVPGRHIAQSLQNERGAASKIWRSLKKELQIRALPLG